MSSLYQLRIKMVQSIYSHRLSEGEWANLRPQFYRPALHSGCIVGDPQTDHYRT